MNGLLERFFDGQAESWALFVLVRTALESIGPFDMSVGKSQVAFRRRVAFAWAWRPVQYLRSPCAPLVLSVGLRRCDPSPRWKEVVEPRPGRYTHHLELYDPAQVDDEVRAWLLEAWNEAA